MTPDSGPTSDAPTSRRTTGTPFRERVEPPAATLGVSDVAVALPGRDRASWRVAGLALCLAACHGQTASAEQLHLLSWAIRDEANAKEMADVWAGVSGAPRRLRAWDPKLADTIQLALAARLVISRPNGKYKLSPSGQTLVRRIRDEPGLFEAEQRALAQFGTLSETRMWQTLGAIGLREVRE